MQLLNLLNTHTESVISLARVDSRFHCPLLVHVHHEYLMSSVNFGPAATGLAPAPLLTPQNIFLSTIVVRFRTSATHALTLIFKV